MAMARQQELISDESPKETHNGDEHPPRTESKRKKFRPFRAVRNMFRKRMRRQGSENLQDYKKSRSTTELQNDEDGTRRFSSPNSPYSVGLSVSHDSIFSPDHATASLDPQELRSIHGFLSVQHVELKDLKNELFARIRARRDSDDEDAGLPHSPCTSPTTADILSQNLKSKSGISRTTCSEGSLISMGSSENDEDLMGMVLSSHSSRMSLSDKRFQDSDETDVSQPVPLSHKAAHHKIAVRPKRTHGLPRHRKQQLAASRLGSLPSTPEISEDSGRPSSGSLQSSEIYLSEVESSGMDSQSIITSLDFTKKTKQSEETAISDSVTSLSPLFPNEQLTNVMDLKSPKPSVFSSYELSPKWNVSESLECMCNNTDSKNISPDGENMSLVTPSDEKKIINKDYNETNDKNDSPQEKREKETKGVFSAWGAKMRKSSDMDRSEKTSKNDQDDDNEPFLSRWFGSRRSHGTNKRNSDECSTPSPKEDLKQHEKQISPETNTKSSVHCNGKNDKNNISTIAEKKSLFLNLDVSNVNNGLGLRNSTQSSSDSSKERLTKSQNIVGQCQMENEDKQVSNKYVIKSSSDDCVHYSLSLGKPQINSPNSEDHKLKTAEKCQERDSELKVVTSTLTTWADLKKAQNLKQDAILTSQHNENSVTISMETQRTKLFNGHAVDKVLQCERPSSLDIVKQISDQEFRIETNNSNCNWNCNLKNLSTNFKQDTVNGINEKDVLKTSKDPERNKNIELPIPNRLKPETKVEKSQESDNIDDRCNSSEKNDRTTSTVSVDNRIETVSTFQDIHSSDRGIEQSIDSTKEQPQVHSDTITNSKPSAICNNNNGFSRFMYRRSNSVSKADIKTQSTSHGKISIGNRSPGNNGKSSPDSKSCEKKETEVEMIEPSWTDQNKNVGKISPKSVEDGCNKDSAAIKQNLQSDSSFPPNSELFRVFARRSMKQKHVDKEKQDKPLDQATAECVNGQENLNTETNCVHASSPPKDKIANKGSSEIVAQSVKVGTVQEIFIPRPRIVPVSTQSKESNVEKRTQRNSIGEITQEIHIPRPRSHTTSDSSQSNDSVPDMRTRKSSVPESSKKSFIKSKEEPCEEVKSGRAVNDRDKSKSFKLNNTRNSPPDTRSADDNLQPSWLRLAQQRREQREQKEKQLHGSSSPPATETIAKPARSTKVLDMVSSFQKLQMT